MLNSYLARASQLCATAIPVLLLSGPAVAQSQSVSGTVTDDKGTTLPGATVLVRGTSTGTSTDAQGAYTISVPSNAVLVVTYLGFVTREVPVEGKTQLNLTLTPDAKQLNEVVVTALGIKREQKALGYATQTIGGDALLEARPNNFSQALSGKVAGLNLISSGSGPVNSTRISLRGDNSLNPNGNNALIVLDGVPMNSGLTSSGVGSAYGAGAGNDVPVDFGNGIADINPDDIASITVLKGASATALYGSRAANGALIITTKTGSRQKKGLGVTVNSNYSVNTVLQWPEYQYEYGQGTGRSFNAAGEMYYSYGASADGASTGGTSSAFGPKFNGQQYYQYDPLTQAQSAERLPWVPYEDNIKGFFRTGSTLTNSVALEGGNETSSARASVTHSKNEWIMPNTGYERLTAALSVNHSLTPKLKLAGKVNFTNRTADNLPATGYNNQSLSYFMIFQNPNVPLDAYRTIWKYGLDQVDQVHPFSSFIDNPYLIAYEMTNSAVTRTTVGNISGTYDFTKDLSLLVRSGIAMTQEQREMRRPYSTANFQKGYFKQQDISNYEINTDFLLTYHKEFQDRFDLRASVGGNAMRRRNRSSEASVRDLVIPGVYKLANGANTALLGTTVYEKDINSNYALLTASYDDKIFIDLTGRNDWSSSLPVENLPFSYPSVSTSFILNELLPLPASISLAKLRLSAAKVGNDTDPYGNNKYYGRSDFPGAGSVATTLYNKNLKPEQTVSYEAGLEYLMFQGRIGADLTVYQNTTRNQILEVPIDPTTGYTRALLNAGAVRNRGVEVVLNTRPIDNNAFKWKNTLTWSRNRNKVLSLAGGLEDQQVIGAGGTATLLATVGGTTGDIYGYGFDYSPEGKIIYNKDGLPVQPANIKYIGRAYADWKGGFLNEFSYKNFRVSVLLDGQYGGIVYSQTHHKMSEQGKLKSTLPGREEGFIIGDGVVANGDGTYSPNTTKVIPAAYYAEFYRRANIESNSFDASYLKLREARMEFSLPAGLLARTKALTGATIGLYGRDLAMWTKFPMFDPETAALNGGTILPGVEIGQLPSTRTMGVNLTLQF
ncbi:SusC/RagA family TonB-linked outer membrane protein [Hymenobacter cellulosilyticus]|uniref:SusC/RagA family TonB-linked outer membrane protein n=1 Tax=Hymenobacter cellulosilyticus TaxID=2932248 RepID=A0A8T9Q2U4_9BACT|nr:SusC/RagA family TonB-linked outer membrane protein [Hymenobacter cellulosilyticus]UOQ70178.1 SusC/RagA family TonB-linked outer membrane protein [Hymenobacter cellulosilyticus]